MALTSSQTGKLRSIIVARREALQAEILGDVARAEEEQYRELAWTGARIAAARSASRG